MARTDLYLLLSLAIILGASATLPAQTDESIPSSHVKALPPILDVDQATDGHVKELPPTAALPKNIPFAIENPKTGTADSIKVLSEEQMSRQDRDLVADAQSSIQERAGFENLDFNGEGWTYHELICPAMPNHMFLRFTRDDGTRQMSMFSAAIPRNGNGRVHIIPIVRKGYSLFSPAPIGALTIAAFNRVRVEEGSGTSAEWLGTALCYAALAGANPQVGEMKIDVDKGTGAVFPPTLTIGPQGDATISFADVAAVPKPMEWTMIFDSKGKLLKAGHTAASVEHVEKSSAVVEDAGHSKP